MIDQHKKRDYREQWAKEFGKICLWCGVNQHNGNFCQHSFSQTWDKDNTDSDHFENWLAEKFKE